VPFATCTFFHYLEHLVSPAMPFSLYTAEPFIVPVVDVNGEHSEVTTFAKAVTSTTFWACPRRTSS
jgi:hypothetical protein